MLRESLLYEAIEADRLRDSLRRRQVQAIREGRVHTSPRSSIGARILALARPDHSLTEYPCRLPDGTLGRVAVVDVDGEWTLVCRVA